MNENRKKLVVFLIKYSFILVAAGVFIGMFHRWDQWVAVVLAIGLAFRLYRKRNMPADEKKIYYLGLILSAGLGSLCEFWGTSNGYWQYHNLDDGRNFPLWLPFAWASAFGFLYSIEQQIISLGTVNSAQTKILITIIVAAIFPTIGEIVTIHLGVWTYYWDYQLLGVPALAIFLLVVFHTGIYLFLKQVCIRKNINSPVFYSPS